MMDLMINVSQFRKPSKEDYYTILQAETTFIPAKLKKRNLAIVYAYLWNNEKSYGKHNYNVLFGIVFFTAQCDFVQIAFFVCTCRASIRPCGRL